MNIHLVRKSRLVWIIVIICVSLGLVGAALAAVSHVDRYVSNELPTSPVIQSGRQPGWPYSPPPSPPSSERPNTLSQASPSVDYLRQQAEQSQQLLARQNSSLQPVTHLRLDPLSDQMRQKAMSEAKPVVQTSALQGEVNRVEFWTFRSQLTWIWGGAEPNLPITITTSSGETLYSWSDGEGNFGTDHPVYLYLDDLVTVTAGAGIYPVTITIPDGWVDGDSVSDVVNGHISYTEWEVQIQPWGWGDIYTTTTSLDGDFSMTLPVDIPPQGRGNIEFYKLFGTTNVETFFHYPFYDLQPAIVLYYSDDVVYGLYNPGIQTWITVTDGADVIKATAHGTTGETHWSGGDTVFDTTFNVRWDGARPDIQPGDYIYLELSNGRTAEARVGEISGNLNLIADTISGYIDASWLADPVRADCVTYVDGNPIIIDLGQIDPNHGAYTCDFGAVGYDILPGSLIFVEYYQSDMDNIINDFQEPAPDLRINTWGQGQANLGNNYLLEVHYNNDGWVTAPDLVITQTLSGMTYLSDTSGVVPVVDGSTVVWHLGDLPYRHICCESFFYVFVHIDDPNTVFSQADIDSSLEYYQDENRKHSYWETSVSTDTESDLNIGKWAWTGDPVPGHDFVFTVNVCNNSPNASSEVFITDTLPLSTTLVDWWAGSEPGWEVVIEAPQQLVLKRPTMTSYRCGEVDIQVHLSEQAWPGISLHNQAWVWAASDPDPRIKYADWWGNAGWPIFNLHLSNGWHWGQFAPGGDVNFELNVSNWGNMPMTGTVLTTTFPQGTEFLYAYYADWYGWHPYTPTVIGDGYLVWDMGIFLNGDNKNIGIGLRIAGDAQPGTPFDVAYSVTGDEHELRYDDNLLAYNETINPFGPNLRVDKHTNWWWNGNGQLSYELRIYNLGTWYLDNVVITDTYPVSTTFNSCGWNSGPGNLLPCEVDEANHQVIWRLEYMYSGETASAWLNVDLAPEDVGAPRTFVNQADISDYGDIVPQDNHDEAIAAPTPHLWISAETWSEPAYGNNYEFKVHYNNDGWLDAPDVTISQELFGMTYLGDTSGLPHTGTGAPGDPLVWEVGNLPYNHQSDSWFEVFVRIDDPDIVSTFLHIDTSLVYFPVDEGAKYFAWYSYVVENTSEININKWAWTWDPVPGQDFVYVVNTCNNGSTSSSEIIMTDTLPLSTTLVGWQGQHPGWELDSELGNQLVFTRPTLPGYWCSQVFMNVQLSVQAWEGMPLTNEAWNWAASDTNPDNNYIRADHSVGHPTTNIHLAPSWTGRMLVPGGYDGMMLDIQNQGNMPVPGTVLTATLPPGTEFYSAWYTYFGDEWYPFIPSIITDEYLVWDIGNFPNGYNYRVSVYLRISEDVPPGTLLDVQYSVMGDTLEYRYDDNILTLSSTVRQDGVNLSVDEHTNWWWNDWYDESGHHQQIFYELHVFNQGTEFVDNPIVTDTYPISTTVSWCGWGHGPFMGCEVDTENHQVIYYLDGLNPGETANAQLQVDLAPEEVGVQGLAFFNQVEISDIDDIYPGDNLDELTIFTGLDTYVKKWLKEGDIVPGGLITYSVDMGNLNRWPISYYEGLGSLITDTIPEHTTFVRAFLYLHPEGTWDPVINGRQLTWTFGPWLPDVSWRFDVTVQIDEDIPIGQGLLNTVEAWSNDPSDIDIDPANNTFDFLLEDFPGAFGKTAPANGAVGVPTNPTLSWESSDNALQYEYCYDTTDNDACDGAWTSTGTDTSVDLSGLVKGTTYYWQVRSLKVGGTTYANQDGWWSFTVIIEAPAAFSKLEPEDGAMDVVINTTLSWEGSLRAASYAYCYDLTDDDTCDGDWLTTTNTSVALSGLINNKTYYWQVRAVNAGGTTEADAGTWWSFTTVEYHTLLPITMKSP